MGQPARRLWGYVRKRLSGRAGSDERVAALIRQRHPRDADVEIGYPVVRAQASVCPQIYAGGEDHVCYHTFFRLSQGWAGAANNWCASHSSNPSGLAWTQSSEQHEIRMLELAIRPARCRRIQHAERFVGVARVGARDHAGAMQTIV